MAFRILALPALIAVVAAVYWLVSGGEPAGSSLLLIFAAAMAVFLWVLLPTANYEGQTAPVDHDFDP